MKNESCLRWDSNPRHSALRTDVHVDRDNTKYICEYVHVDVLLRPWAIALVLIWTKTCYRVR